MFSTPAVAGDLLIVGSCNGMIRALDRSTGQVCWEYDIRKDGQQHNFHGDPLITEDLIVIGTDGNMGHVYAFDRASGKVRWKYPVAEMGVATDVLRLGSNAYAVTLGDELVCLDLNTGTLKWKFRSRFKSKDWFWTSTPAVNTNRVYFAGLDGTLYALDAESGKVVWSRDLGERIETSVAVRGSDLYVGTAKRRLHRLNASTGDVLGSFTLDAEPHGPMLITGDSLVVFLGEDMLIKVDLGLKKLQWTQTAAKEWSSARPYLWRGNVLAANRRELTVLHAADGRILWSRQFPGTVRGIGATDTVLYVGTLQGPIYAYAPGK